MRRLLLLSAITLLLAGCASGPTSSSTGEYLDDSVLTTKVKTVLFRDSVTGGFAITVITFKGTVQLSGFVNTDDEKDRAGTLAKAVAGVKDVKNDLIVKGK